MRISKYWLVLIFFWIFGSCKENTLTPTPFIPYQQPNDLRKVIPLEIGHSWKYEGVDELYETLDTAWITARKTVVDTLSVLGQTNYRIKWEVQTIYANGGRPDTIRDEWLELESVDSSRYIRRGYLTILKLPLQNFNQWYATEGDTLGRPYGKLSIEDADKSVVVDCIPYEHAVIVSAIRPFGFVMFGFTIVPGIGIVEHFEHTNYSRSYLKLVERNF